MLRPEVAIARKLRREMSYPEVMLWQRLRGKALGCNFRKQHPIGPYVADFCCLSVRLVVEVEGAVHDGEARAAHDDRRESFIIHNGFRVLRVAATDVQRDIEAVIAAIVALAEAPLHRPSDGPPPRSGEDI
jgi:very-short-patch-repair endonuclease